MRVDKRCVAAMMLFWIAAMPAAQAEPLTEEMALRTLATTRELAPLVAAHQEAWEAWGREHAQSSPDGADPCVIPEDAKNLPGYDDMLATIRSNGFTDTEAYCRAAMQIHTACMANRVAEEDPQWRDRLVNRNQHIEDARRQMEASLREVDADATLTDDQKQQIRRFMSEKMAQVDEMKDSPVLTAMETVSPEDMAVVKPHCDELFAMQNPPAP